MGKGRERGRMRGSGGGFGGTNKIPGEINERCYTGVSRKVCGEGEGEW